MAGVLGHSHGHSHTGEGGNDHTEHENINVKAAFIHVLGDFLQSLGVFIAALVIFFKVQKYFSENSDAKMSLFQPEWNIIDPICTFAFSILILGTTLRILRDTLNVLMGGDKKKLFNVRYWFCSKIQGTIQFIET